MHDTLMLEGDTQWERISEGNSGWTFLDLVEGESDQVKRLRPAFSFEYLTQALGESNFTDHLIPSGNKYSNPGTSH